MLARSMLCACSGWWQADIDAAFRRIPVAAKHRWACGVVFKLIEKVRVSLCVKDACGHAFVAQVMASQHYACPFGAIASVHAWERVGAAIAHIARKFLKVAVLRYVGDLFASERCVVSCRDVHWCSVACMLGEQPWSTR